MGAASRSRPHVLLRLTAVCAVLAVVLAAQYALIATHWALVSIEAVGGTPPLSTFPLAVASVLVPLGLGAWCHWRALRTADGLADYGNAAVLGKAITGAGLIVLAVGQFTLGVGCQVAARGPIPDPEFVFSIAWSYRATYLPQPVPVIEYHAGGPCWAAMDALPVLAGVALLAAGLWYEDWTDAILAAVETAVTNRLGDE